MFACIIFIAAYFLPESPRWLYVNNKQDQAKAMLTKFHGEGNPDSEWVKLQLNEYEELLEMDGADKRWWDYRALFKNRSTCYRLFCNVSITVFGQWAGNGKNFPPKKNRNMCSKLTCLQPSYLTSCQKYWILLASMVPSARLTLY
jgi:hypothetical protein